MFSYREAISLLYTRVSFDLLDGPTAHRFLTLVPISQLNQIKHLRIAVIFLARCCHSTSSPHSSPEKRLEATKQFQEICVILQRMKGLNELRLGIFRDPEQIVSNREFLAPLESVSVQKGGVFVVTLPVCANPALVFALFQELGARLLRYAPKTCLEAPQLRSV